MEMGDGGRCLGYHSMSYAILHSLSAVVVDTVLQTLGFSEQSPTCRESISCVELQLTLRPHNFLRPKTLAVLPLLLRHNNYFTTETRVYIRLPRRPLQAAGLSTS